MKTARIICWSLACLWALISLPRIIGHSFDHPSVFRVFFFGAWMLMPAVALGVIGHLATRR